MALKSGFSLIELTVVVGLLGVLTLAISTIMLTSILTSNRIRTTTKVKQAGAYTLTQIQSLLRSSKAVALCDSSDASISVIGQDGGVTQIAQQIDGGTTRIASGSGLYLTPADVRVESFTLNCTPSDAAPTLVKVSFDLRSTIATSQTQNPLLHFETSINLRNE